MARIKVPKQLGLMKVHAPKHAMRFVGEFSKELTTEIGCLIRRNLPPHVEDWTKIPAARKESVITELKVTLKNNFKFTYSDFLLLSF